MREGSENAAGILEVRAVSKLLRESEIQRLVVTADDAETERDTAL